MKKRMIGWALTLGMVMGLLPAGAGAAAQLSAPTDIFWGTEPSIDSSTGKPFTIPVYDPSQGGTKEVPILDPLTGMFAVDPSTGKPYVEAYPPAPSVRQYRRGVPGEIYFSIPRAGQPVEPDWQGTIRLCLYEADANGDNRTKVAQRTLRYFPTQDNGGNSYADNLFIAEVDRLNTGYYVMGLTCMGDGRNYLDSDEALSKVWNYIRPSGALSQIPASGLSWNWPKAQWSKLPEDTGNLEDNQVYQYEVEWCRQDTATATDRYDVGGKYTGQTEAEINNEHINTGAAGFYSFRVRGLSRDVTQWINGPWSEYSPLHDLTQTQVGLEGVLDQLEKLTSPTGADICSAVQGLNTRDLKDTMLADLKGNRAVLDRMAAMEEKITGAPTPVRVGPGAPADLGSGVSVLGAQMNTSGAGGVELSIDAPQAKDLTIPKLYHDTLAIKFSMTVTGGGIDPGALKVPVQITLPVPSTIQPEFLWILHYPADGGDPESIHPFVFEENGKWYASIVLDHFSDFVMTALKSDVPDPTPTGAPDPTPTDTPDPAPTDVPDPTPTQTPDGPTGGGSTGGGPTGGGTSGGGSTGGGTSGGGSTGGGSTGSSTGGTTGGSSSGSSGSRTVASSSGSGKSYKISLPTLTNGQAELSKKTAQKGETVTLVLKPDEGCVLERFHVADQLGRTVETEDLGEGQYSFIMPGSKVSVQVNFEPRNKLPPTPAQTVTTVERKFTDVAPDGWYLPAVQYVIDKGLMGGMTTYSFGPEVPASRAMLVTALYRMEGEPKVDRAGFLDLEKGFYYLDAVSWAAQHGIVTGFEDNTFRPNGSITREQLAAILYRYAGAKGMDVSARADLSGYADALRVSSYAGEALSWAKAVGLITGYEDNTLRPDGEATRAQVAAILTRFHGG